MTEVKTNGDVQNFQGHFSFQYKVEYRSRAEIVGTDSNYADEG